MKVTILGAGNAGCFTAVHYAFFTRHHDVEIELIHNPDIKPEPVGQATFPNEPELLDDALGFNWHNNTINATPKTGILYEGWGKVNEEVFHPFPSHALGMHFSPSEMQNYILKSGVFNVVEDNIPDPKDVDADYVFDCRGKPKDYSDYDTLINPINAVVLAKPNWDTSTTLWTRSVATPDGWAFIIPTKVSSGAIGYLYNSDITSKEGAESNLLDMFDAEITNHLNFKSYCAKNPVVDDRIFLNGNRLFFLEPLEATAVHTYLQWAKDGFTVNCLKKASVPDASAHIISHIKELQNFILWHYQFGSKYDTPFWKYASSLKFTDPKFDFILNQVDELDINEIKFREIVDDYPAYGAWHRSSLKWWKDGMTIPQKYAILDSS